MKTIRYENSLALTPTLQRLLDEVRFRRGFCSLRCIEAKALLINRYFKKYGLSSATIGISGGIDSAVTLGLIKHAASLNGSPIKRITPLLLPFSIDQGVTNQEFATSRGATVVQSYGLSPVTIDLGAGFNGIRAEFVATGNGRGDAWADGQLAAYLRTPALYYATALNTQQGFPGIVCGTTNRDEGAYLGFFGKASDGMVDVQLISDLHKSEVYSLARALKVPSIAMTTPPTGDVYDGKSHLEMIGAPYDFVELYISHLRENYRDLELLDAESREQYTELAERIEAMHRYNLHKYLGESPSVHLDIYQRGVPGGWSDSKGIGTKNTQQERKLVAEFALKRSFLSQFSQTSAKKLNVEALADNQESALKVDGILTPAECTMLIAALEGAAQVPVGINGMVRDYDPGKTALGSLRATLYSEELAEILWKRLQGYVQSVRCFDQYSMTDSQGHPVWRAIGVNPSLRFIKYPTGGKLVPHYDAGYDFGDNRRHTLMSVVFYLTDGIDGMGGQTRFIRDSQRNAPSSERTYSDWTRAASENEVLFRIQPKIGSALLFDHRLLHDSEGWNGETPRIIIRTDIIFEKCGVLDSDEPTASIAVPEERHTPRSRALERAFQDPFFKHTASRYTYGELVEAGFFDDGAATPLDPEAEKELFCTPVHKVVRNYAAWSSDPVRKKKTPAVLISTGGFCPIHKGHLSMMESARTQLESEGFAVLGGFLAPDHDQYIVQKCGTSAISAAERIHYIDLATENSDWLSADPWPALYAERALNFTDIIRRLETYLAHQLRQVTSIQVVYVCGGDNALFARAFVARGRCVIVHRSGEREKMALLESELSKIPADRVSLAEARLADPAASRLIREGNIEHLPETLQKLWAERQKPAQGPIRIYLRDEGSWATNLWLNGRSAIELERARRDFLAGVRLAFIKVFNTSASRRDFAFRTISAAQQQLKLKEYIKRKRAKLVSLDAVIPAQRNISISRCFELCDSKRRGDFTTRPGSPELHEQLQNLGHGRFIVYDDDIATGQTIRALIDLLPPECHIDEIISLFTLVTNDHLDTVEMSGEQTITDIGDLRDFLVGSRDGGLTVSLPDGTLARAPYLLPYVRNAKRMSIPVIEEVEFSRLLWKLNVEFFSQFSKPIAIEECSSDFQLFAHQLGWDNRSSMRDFSLWHLQKMERHQIQGSDAVTSNLVCGHTAARDASLLSSETEFAFRKTNGAQSQVRQSALLRRSRKQSGELLPQSPPQAIQRVS